MDFVDELALLGAEDLAVVTGAEGFVALAIVFFGTMAGSVDVFVSEEVFGTEWRLFCDPALDATPFNLVAVDVGGAANG